MELIDRMAMTVEGQVTWANPDLGEKCSACGHFKQIKPRRPSGDGRCSLVLAVTGNNGKPFYGSCACACSKFIASTPYDPPTQGSLL